MCQGGGFGLCCGQGPNFRGEAGSRLKEDGQVRGSWVV